MLTITEQLSKAHVYLKPVYETLVDSKISSVAVTALSLVASAFSYFTMPQVVSYSLAGLSVLAACVTATIFHKLNVKNRQAAAEKEAAAKKLAEEALRAEELKKKEPSVVNQPGIFARFWRSSSDEETQGNAAAAVTSAVVTGANAV